MSTLSRLAILAGLLLATLALGLTLAPTTANGVKCGTWVSPEWSEEAVDGLAAQADGAGEVGVVIVARARANEAACNDALSTRRNLALGSLVLAVVVPAGMVWAGRGRGNRGNGDQLDRTGDPNTRSNERDSNTRSIEHTFDQGAP